ncbi:MAG TPA: beta-propeller fold lactonase family protein [Candidatus Angelobacter sp.]|nr:beta-propeller fold lactonase family protein [Candidatus Angelobacter sp.]
MKAGILAATVTLAALVSGCGGGATAGAPGAKGTSVYVLGPGTNEVLAFNENVSGALVPIQGSPTAATGSVPVGMAVHPSGKIAFIANESDGTITILVRNTGNGALSVPPIPTGALNPPPPIIAGANPVATSLTPNGNFLYVLNQGSNNISAFSVDVVNNILNGIAAVATGLTNPQFMTVSPDSKTLYVSSPTSGTIASYAIATDGNLSAAAVSSVGGSPSFMVVDPLLRFLYVTDPATNSVRVFSLSGGLVSTEISGSPFHTGANPSSLAINASASFLLCTNFGANNLSGFSIAPSGTLTPVSGSPFATGINPSFVVIDKTNTFVYVADQGSNDVTAFSLNGTQLRGLVGAPFGVGTSPTWISTAP